MSLWNKDKEIIRNAFKRYSKKDLHASDYQEAVKSLERMHANFFLKYCKAQGYNRQKTIDLYTANHDQMISLLNAGMDIHHFPEEITQENHDKKNPWGYFLPPSEEPMKGLKEYATAFDNNEISQLVPKLNAPSYLPKNVTEFYPNVPDPDDQDPIERLEYMESYVSKKQFVLMQFIKIYIVLQQQSKLNIFNLNHLIKTMEIALKGEKVLLAPDLIRDLQIPKKIQCYFLEYGEIYK